jgi:hypothetical protein
MLPLLFLLSFQFTVKGSLKDELRVSIAAGFELESIIRMF